MATCWAYELLLCAVTYVESNIIRYEYECQHALFGRIDANTLESFQSLKLKKKSQIILFDLMSVINKGFSDLF